MLSQGIKHATSREPEQILICPPLHGLRVNTLGIPVLHKLRILAPSVRPAEVTEILVKDPLEVIVNPDDLVAYVGEGR